MLEDIGLGRGLISGDLDLDQSDHHVRREDERSALLIGTAATDHLAKKGQPGAPALHGRRIERGRLIFVYRAAFVGLAAFAAALVGFGLQELLPAAYLATSKSMISSIVGLIASLSSIVLGLLVWTSHGQFIGQQTAAPDDCGRCPSV